jgi:O-antigen/teichoic acid export membrane protein
MMENQSQERSINQVMSTDAVVTPAPFAFTPPQPAMANKLLKLFTKAGRGAFWPLADQGVASLGNILTVFLVGRAVSKDEFGIFALVIEALLFLLSLHAGLITYPLTVRGAVAERPALARLTASALLLTLVLAIPLIPVSLGVGFYYRLPAIGAMALAALVTWELQEVVRRALLSHFRHSEAVWGDAVAYLGQAGLLALLSWRHELTLYSTLAVMAATNVAALLLQAAQVGLANVSRQELIETASDFWQRGRLLALSNCNGLWLIVCGNWSLGLSHGAAQVADFAAITQLLKICNPVMQTIGNLIVPASVKALDRGGMPAARRIAFKISALASLLVAPVWIVLFAIPGLCLTLAFRGKYSAVVDQEALRFVVCGYIGLYLNTALSSFLNGVHRTRDTFIAQTVGSVTNVLVLLPLTIAFGMIGYAMGGLLPVLVQLVILLWFMRRAK